MCRFVFYLGDDGFHAIRGTTDTEHIFALIAERLRGHEDDSSCELLADALAGGIRDLHELIDEHAPGTHCYLNLVLTDGRHAAACRYSSDPGYKVRMRDKPRRPMTTSTAEFFSVYATISSAGSPNTTW